MLPLLSDLKMALDPVRMAQAAGIVPDDWQARVLRSASPRLLLNCSRQSGKSTISALMALHAALYMPGSLVLLLAPSLRQSQELFRKVKDAARALSLPSRAIEEESALRIELVAGGRIVCLPGKEQTIRGFSAVSLLIVDEAARVDDALYYAVRPMLAVSGGRLILLSTPMGKRGFFFEEWQGANEWLRVEVKASDCPRIPAAFLTEERRALGPWYEQEYGCQFLDNQFQVFSYESVMGALSDEVKPLFGGGDGAIYARA